MTETQKSVADWCEEFYPGESATQKFINLLEEVIELGWAMGVSKETFQKTVDLTLQKSDPSEIGDTQVQGKEIGDVQLSVYNLAEELKFDTHACLDGVMSGNRQKKLEECVARAKKKRDMGLKG